MTTADDTAVIAVYLPQSLKRQLIDKLRGMETLSGYVRQLIEQAVQDSK